MFFSFDGLVVEGLMMCFVWWIGDVFCVLLIEFFCVDFVILCSVFVFVVVMGVDVFYDVVWLG